jgi:hypothetical protein
VSSNDAIRGRVTAALQDIEDAQRELGIPYCDPGDFEAHAIVTRIERRLSSIDLKRPLPA